MPTALLRPAELVASDIVICDGVLHIPAHTLGQMIIPARDIPLGGAAMHVLGGDGLIYERLDVGRHGPGGFLRTLNDAYVEVAPEGPDTLEQLWASLIHAAVGAHDEGSARRTVMQYSGLPGSAPPRHSSGAQWSAACDIARFLDTQIRACGYAWSGQTEVAVAVARS